MFNFIQKLWARLTKRSQKSVEVPARGHNRMPKTVVVNREDEGAHFYLRDILNDIRETHKALRKLRKVDQDAYYFQGRVGARVLPERKFRWNAGSLPDDLPSIGMWYLSNRMDDSLGGVLPRLLYFQKVDKPIDVQVFDGIIYRISSAYINGGNVYAGVFHVGIGDGGIIPLRCKKFEMERIRYTVHSNGKKKKKFRVAGSGLEKKRGTMYWDYPEYVKGLWQFNNDLTLEEYVRELVCICMSGWVVSARDELQVRAQRRGITALFSVSTKRTPYFFKDRETTVAADGKRKRIFHIVRGHDRELKDGRLVAVKEHYRGERRFKWDGSDVVITVPDMHHTALEKFTGAAVEYEDDVAVPEQMITAKEAGKRLSEAMS